ncbi:hypothetical protein ASG90_08665 [Nocardioides sp. Soil797]|nr:hypothetical protein ASG90_08665 [Nocardioides sp. Soil797]
MSSWSDAIAYLWRVPTSSDPRGLMRSLLPWAWSFVLAALLLGPALAPGYLLSYDMVWVPDLALRPDFLGVGSALPRAVPSDAVVAVLDEVIPGMVLQKVVLLGSLVSAGAGSAALVRGSMLTRMAVSTFVVWNPFVVERLLLGHWPVLLGYAVLPWLILVARRGRESGPGPALCLLVPLGSLSAGAGLVTALVVLGFGWSGRLRQDMRLFALLLAGNAPWIFSGLLHVGEATSDARAATLFALHGEGHLPAPLAALGMGGIWNAEVVPATRAGVLGVVMTVLIVVVAAAGFSRWLREETRRDRWVQVVLWCIGWGWAVFTWAASDATGWLVSHVPAGGLLRDGSRLLALCLPLFIVLLAHGAHVLRARVRDEAAALITAVGLVLVPIALMPDAAWGVSGDLAAVDFPDGYDAARVAMDGHRDGTGADGDVVVLPFSAYRAPTWNHGRKVLDPLPRFLDRDYVSNDELVVDDVLIRGEDPRVPEVRDALGLPTAQERARALAELGIGFVVFDSSGPHDGLADGPDDRPGIAGDVIVDEGPVRVVALAGVSGRSTPLAWSWVAGLGWALFVGLVVVGSMGRVVRGRTRQV